MSPANSQPRAGSPEERSGTQSVIECREISAGYDDLIVLRSVSLSLTPGRITALLGRNGAGKTTLASTIAGILPLRHGQLILNGEDISSTPAHVRARLGIGLVQEGKRVFRERTVRENLLLGTFGRRLSRGERNRVVEESYELFPDLARYQKRRAGELSGGQQQMVAIAQVLAAAPSVVILDEPSAGLAPSIIDMVLATVSALKERGPAVLLIEQLVEKTLAVADYVVLLENGVVARQGTRTEISDSQSVLDAYFGDLPPHAGQASAGT